MSTVNPSGVVTLYEGTGLNDYSNEYVFDNESAQQSFFFGKRARSYQNFQYARGNTFICVPVVIDSIVGCDYMRFQNGDFSTKFYYAFIVGMEYVNDSTTKIHFKVDVWQTWMFDVDLTLKNFIHRAHESYVPYYDRETNYYPENLEMGSEYVVQASDFISFQSGGGAFLIATSIKLVNTNFGTVENPLLQSTMGGTFDGVPSALDYYVCDYGSAGTIEMVLSSLAQYPWVAQGIQSITYVPEIFINSGMSLYKVSGTSVNIYRLNNGYTSKAYTQTFDLAKFGDVSLWNNKLLTYPYSFVELSGYNGQVFKIKPQYLDDAKFTIKCEFNVGVNSRITVKVLNYLGMGETTSENYYAGIVFNDLPQFPILKDNYILWLANQSHSIGATYENLYESNWNKQVTNVTDALMSLLGGSAGALSRESFGAQNPSYQYSGQVGYAMQGANTIYEATKNYLLNQSNYEQSLRQLNARQEDAQLIPPTLIATQGGDTFNIARGVFGVTLKWKTILPQYADRLTNYFTRFGYVVNKFRPLSEVIRLRDNFTYVQTEHCYIEGKIPKEDTIEMERMFDNGVTMWKSQIGVW